MEFTLKEGVVLRLSLTSTRYQNGLVKKSRVPKTLKDMDQT